MPLKRLRRRFQRRVGSLSRRAADLDASTREGARLESVRELFAGELEDYPALDHDPYASRLFGWCAGVADVLELSLTELLDAYDIHDATLRVRRDGPAPSRR